MLPNEFTLSSNLTPRLLKVAHLGVSLDHDSFTSLTPPSTTAPAVRLKPAAPKPYTYLSRHRNDVPSLRSSVAYSLLPPHVTRYTPVKVAPKQLAFNQEATTYRDSPDCISKRYHLKKWLLLLSLSRLQLQPPGGTDTDVHVRTRTSRPGNNNRLTTDQPKRERVQSTASRLIFVLGSLVALLHSVDSLHAIDGRKSWQTFNECSWQHRLQPEFRSEVTFRVVLCHFQA